MSEKLDPDILAGFTGTEQWYRHGLARTVTYTDGVRYVAETAGAYWLLDEIALVQRLGPRLEARSPFQVWTLKRNQHGNGALLTCSDGNEKPIYKKRISYTDFPEPSFTLWLADNVILLPSEY